MSTIIAPSTPSGRGAITVIRLSGDTSLQIARSLAVELDNVKPRYSALVNLRFPGSGHVLDEVLVTYFPRPHSVTGEDVVEISCHGSPVVVRQILDLAVQFGARLAGPGEFSLRGVSNGKIDLAEAEAIRDLIAAQTEAAVKQASRQVGGELSRTVQRFEDQLVKIIVQLESALEFVEDDLPATEMRAVREILAGAQSGIHQLAETYSSGRLLQAGLKVAIVGRPNVGKSSLFNRLLEHDRAIVTEIPGTTRDTLSHAIDIGGIPVLLTDTAGLRETTDSIESLGIERTWRAIDDADLVLEVLDAGGDVVEDRVESKTEIPSILVFNKCDLTSKRIDPLAIYVSALTGEGLDELRAAILELFTRADRSQDGLLITNARQYELLKRAADELDTARELLEQNVSEEMVLVPLHNALKCLGQITGETTTEDILTQVFSTFCIGK
jgi:tRNA modification GTPase